MCHSNGSAPHLTPYGYMYRRAGFRPPQNIGNKDADSKTMTIYDHIAAGTNISYEFQTQKPLNTSDTKLVANQINVPEVEIWPLVGSFLGNFAAWSEIDASPSISGSAGSVALGMADLRYASGTPDFFFNFRAGYITSEGFGASDQWFDDGNTPLMDQASAYYNQDTLALPFGAMGEPQMGAEFGLNYHDAHFTFGFYNGYNGLSGGLTAASTNQGGISKDYKFQLDQFLGDLGAITVGFYHGSIPLIDPSNTFNWADQYNVGRLYLTYFAIPGTLDLLAGGALSSNQYVTVDATPSGTFTSRGAFLGALYYAMPHLSLGARLDFNQFSTEATNSPAVANGFSIQASLPFDNNIFNIAFNRTLSELASGNITQGTTNNFRLSWRFLL